MFVSIKQNNNYYINKYFNVSSVILRKKSNKNLRWMN